jgi:uncharacterized protein YaeQ
MSGKYSFHLESDDHRFPQKIIVGQQDTETITHVVLKFLAYMLFYRERIELEPNLHNDNIPFRPDIVQLDYQLQPVLWVECGECSVQKLDKLAVKVPMAELWVMRKSQAAADDLLARMGKAELRRDRYDVIGLDGEVFEEVCGLLQSRNEVFWVGGKFDPPEMTFDLNGLWFDLSFRISRF